MNRIKHVVSAGAVALGLALAPAAMAAGHGGGGFGGHFGGFGGHVGGFGGHVGGFGGEHATGSIEPVLGGHPLDSGHLAGGGHELGGFASEGHQLGGGLAVGGHEMKGGFDDGGERGEHELGRDFADRGQDMGDGLVLDNRAIGGSHLMYGRMPRYGRGGVFLGYYYPNPAICNQYPGYYNPAVGCYGLYPAG